MLLLALIGCIAGLGGVYLRLRPEFPQGVTFATLALLAGATPIAWYTLVEPSPLDLTAFGLSAWLALPASRCATGRTRVLLWIALLAASLLAIWLTLLSHSALQLTNSRWSAVLFSSWHGLLSWTPAVYLAVAGTIAYARRDRMWAIAALLVLAIASWLVGTAGNWLREPAFGGRPLISVLPVLAPGLAYTIDLLRRRPALAMAPIVAVPIVWNHLLMMQYTVGMLPKDEPVSFARMVRQQADAQSRAWPLYPFAFPANVVFAWREGLPLDRYDTLALEPRVTTLDLSMDRDAGRFLLEGFDGQTAQGEAAGWWIGGRTATLAVPLALPRHRTVRIRVTARSRFEEPVMQADLALLVNGHEVGQFSPGATDATDATITVDATSAIFRDGFNRVSFVSRGVHRVDPGDTRRPGPLARRAGRPAWPVAVYRVVIEPVE